MTKRAIALDEQQQEKLESIKIRVLAYSPDGQTLATASRDNTIKLWSLDFNDVMTRGCDWVKDYLTNNPNISPEDRRICDGYFSNPTP